MIETALSTTPSHAAGNVASGSWGERCGAFTNRALEKAIAEGNPPPGLVHHSDRGVQYASGDYVRILTKHRAIPSMTAQRIHMTMQLRELPQDLETVRDLRELLREPGAPARDHWNLHRAVLQPTAVTLGIGESLAGGV